MTSHLMDVARLSPPDEYSAAGAGIPIITAFQAFQSPVVPFEELPARNQSQLDLGHSGVLQSAVDRSVN